MIVLSFLLIVLVAVVAGAVASLSLLPLIPAIAAVLVGVPLFTWLAVLVYGLRRKAQPLRPFDASEQEEGAARLNGEGHHVTTADGRIVE